MRVGKADRAALTLIATCFGVGATMHAIDFVRLGWFPYRYGPAAFNLFWNLLLFLDIGVILLLIAGKRRAALAAGLAVMIADVAVNSYAWFGLGFPQFAVSVPLQAAFLGFLLGAIGFLWRTE